MKIMDKKRFFSLKTGKFKNHKESKNPAMLDLIKLIKSTLVKRVFFGYGKVYAAGSNFMLSAPLDLGIANCSIDVEQLLKFATLLGGDVFTARVTDEDSVLRVSWGDGNETTLNLTPCTIDIANEANPIPEHAFTMERDEKEESSLVDDLAMVLYSAGLALPSKKDIDKFPLAPRLSYIHFEDGHAMAADNVMAVRSPLEAQIPPFKLHRGSFKALSRIDLPVNKITIDWESPLSTMWFDFENGITVKVYGNSDCRSQTMPPFLKLLSRRQGQYSCQVDKEFWKALKVYDKCDLVEISNGFIVAGDEKSDRISTSVYPFGKGESADSFCIKPKTMMKVKKFACDGSEFRFYSEPSKDGRIKESYLTVTDPCGDILVLAGNVNANEGAYNQCLTLSL